MPLFVIFLTEEAMDDSKARVIWRSSKSLENSLRPWNGYAELNRGTRQTNILTQDLSESGITRPFLTDNNTVGVLPFAAMNLPTVKLIGLENSSTIIIV